jgi:hypothetical protein
MNNLIMPAATDRFADQVMIVTFAVAGRCVEKIDPEIERAAKVAIDSASSAGP